MLKKCIWVYFVLMIALLLNGCNSTKDYWDNDDLDTSSEPLEIIENQTIEELTNASNEEEDIYAYIDSYIDGMTLEEKVGQIFMAAFRHNGENLPVTYLDEKTKELIKSHHLGGIIFFAENIDTVEQTKKLINNMQAISKTPLFIAIDEEGGIVSRLNSSNGMPATKLPGNKVLGMTENPELAYKVGKLLGRELSSLGFNMNLAPVADVNTNPNNPVIGERSFGDDPHKVGKMVGKMVQGIQEQNISAVVKHFPGHGDTSLDTHKEAVTLHHNSERLNAVEFHPFKSGIQKGVDGVMLAHIIVPNITDNNLPATFSEIIIEDILRNQLKHKRLIITDALEMAAISKHWTSEEAAVLAFQAGADILLMPASLEKAYNGLLRAIREGVIPETRLEDSVRRILMIKYERGILDFEEAMIDPYNILGSQEHLQIVEEIYQYNNK
ncbi:beta-N-acetylhexosaminidase [Natronincola peptidivorans]|uniref:beta-N-acetylhexosaminidase n=1 Tax=Natronincola peptidivorans TaxID=426128 RepID=A0A1I0EWB3_9FIRM|nr:glycoside hydrolase family 3 protein [Natronincola peptidivorans]SET49942.1 beta-N-acetylhexosaminidase [Natronincola peptidivorans]